MDEVQMNRLLMQKVGRKFYGHDTLNSKYDPQIPASAEREYVRTTNAYMAILKTELEEQLPRLKEVYKENRDAEVRENRRNDSATDLMLAVAQIFTTIKNNVIAKTLGFGLRRKLESLAHLTRKLTVNPGYRHPRGLLPGGFLCRAAEEMGRGECRTDFLHTGRHPGKNEGHRI